MKTVETLFDTEIVKDKKKRTPESLLQSSLKSAINRFGMYHFKIIFNRVYFGKVKSFPLGINKEQWINKAREIAAEKYGNLIVLVDKKKANQ